MEILVLPIDINPRVCDECPEDCPTLICNYTTCECHGGGNYVPDCDLECVRRC